MGNELELVELPTCRAAAIHLEIARADIQREIEPAIREILECLSAQGVAPTGPMLAHHLAVSDTRFDFEIGFPVEAPIKEVGRVRTIELGPVKALRTTHRGPYEGLHQAWAELGARARARESGGADATVPKGGFREVYRIGPEAGHDSRSWETDLYLPLTRE